MFQTEIILFIQSIASDFWTSFFKFWTEIGYLSWTRVLAVVILFGISFRAGYILIHTLIWNGLFTFYLKGTLALPRPANVDLNVKLLGENYPNPTPFKSMGAKGFFGGLPRNVVEALRANPIDTWGFPSGHTSNVTALWGSISLFFKKTWVWVIAVITLIFIPLSRIYLGRHFLADILGGYVTGAFFVFVFFRFVYKNDTIASCFSSKLEKIHWDLKAIFLFFYSFLLPFLLLLVPNFHHKGAPALLGLNLGFFLLWKRGIPSDKGTAIQRMARVLIAFALFLGGGFLLERGSGLLFQSEPGIIEFIRVALTVFLLIWVSTELNIKLGFYERKI